MNECERRIEAMRRVKQGKKVSHVRATLGRSQVWYYKRAARFKEQGLAGLENRRGQHDRRTCTAFWWKRAGSLPLIRKVNR
jgi:transposase